MLITPKVVVRLGQNGNVISGGLGGSEVKNPILYTYTDSAALHANENT